MRDLDSIGMVEGMAEGMADSTMGDRVSAAVQAVNRDNFCLDEHGEPIHQTSSLETVARLLRFLDVQPGDHVLEIGTGSGYSTALLAQLTGSSGLVASVDVDPELGRRTKGLLGAYPNVHLQIADGSVGWEAYAPYDRVIAWCSVTEVPPAWCQQSSVGAVVVVPMRIHDGQRVIRFVRSAGALVRQDEVEGGFIPLTRFPYHPWEGPDGGKI